MILFCDKTFYLCGRKYLFLNGHSSHWLNSAVDFGPQVSCTCIHVILDGTVLSSLFREKSHILNGRLHAAATERILNDPGCLLLCTPFYMYDMIYQMSLNVLLVTLCRNTGSVIDHT